MQNSSPDWFCPKCGFNNLASVAQCQRCETKNPYLQSPPIAPPVKSTSINLLAILGGTFLVIFIGCAGLLMLPNSKKKAETEHKVDEAALRELYKDSIVNDNTPPEKARQILQDDYEKLLDREFSVMNGIKVEVRPIKGGYRLYGVHSYFTSNTFAIGSEAKLEFK